MYTPVALALTLQGAIEAPHRLDLTRHWVGFAALGIFALAYITVMLEERLHLRKSKPVMVGAGLIWALIGFAYVRAGDTTTAAEALRHSLGEYAELFLFVLVAMTFVSTMEERQVFDSLRAALMRRRLSLRGMFWVTGTIAFFLSSHLDNLTTALVMGTVAITIGRGYPKFIAIACINVVVAANAGGAWSAFGDITTLMVWQAGKADFFDFYRVFIPSLGTGWSRRSRCPSPFRGTAPNHRMRGCGSGAGRWEWWRSSRSPSRWP
jgi:Na+/H+ antiporter NhaD/arsenite permease-like protein